MHIDNRWLCSKQRGIALSMMGSPSRYFAPGWILEVTKGMPQLRESGKTAAAKRTPRWATIFSWISSASLSIRSFLKWSQSKGDCHCVSERKGGGQLWIPRVTGSTATLGLWRHPGRRVSSPTPSGCYGGCRGRSRLWPPPRCRLWQPGCWWGSRRGGRRPCRSVGLALLYGQHGDVIACNFDLDYITYIYAYSSVTPDILFMVRLRYVQLLSISCHVEIASVRGRDGSWWSDAEVSQNLLLTAYVI